MKTHLTLCLQAWNADASHTQNLAKLAWLRRPRFCFSFGELFASALRRGLRHGCVSPSLCSFRSLRDWNALPFNPLMRNFKRNSSCYERIGRNFDRIELRRRSRRKDENSKRDRRSRADSVETLRMRSICVLNRLLDPHLCPKPHLRCDTASHGNCCFWYNAHTERNTTEHENTDEGGGDRRGSGCRRLQYRGADVSRDHGEVRRRGV